MAPLPVLAEETATTPVVMDWFGWDEVEANLLFTAAGVANMLCAVAMSMLAAPRVAEDGSTTQMVDDRTLLLISLAVGAVGWLVMIPPVGGMGLAQFGLGFTLVTVAFPFGRGICLALVGKVLGDAPQGAWMGLMFAFGAVARVVGPFWAVAGYNLVGGWAVFGSAALLFLLSLGAIFLVPTLWAGLHVQADGPAADADADALPAGSSASPSANVSPSHLPCMARHALYGSPVS